MKSREKLGLEFKNREPSDKVSWSAHKHQGFEIDHHFARSKTVDTRMDFIGWER